MTARQLLLSASPPADLDRRERAFFRTIRLPNGTFKTTSAHRLDDFNDLLVRVLRERGATPARLLDLGASSGVSTLELQQALRAAGQQTRVTGADLSVRGYLVGLGGPLRVLTDEFGNVLQYDIGGLALRPWQRRLDWISGYWAGRRVLNTIYRILADQRVRGAINAPSDHGAGQGVGTVTEVALVSRRAREAGIQFVRDDALAEPARELRGKFDVIRVANLMNRAYFDEAQLRRIAALLPARLTGPGAVLAICRTQEDGRNHGSIFAYLGEGRWQVIAELGKGSEVAQILARGA